MPSKLFVWTYLPGQTEPVVAGSLEIAGTAAKPVGTFVYGASYRSRPEAVPLDPVTLPLKSGARRITDLGGVPGVILDACPDVWGIRVITRLYGAQEMPQGYLLLNDPGRAGCLAFSRASDEPPQQLQSREFPLADLLAAAEGVEKDTWVDPELLKALYPGTGGARPKCNLIEDGGVWIAKFSSADDKRISIPRLEHATMALARACGIDAAETRLREVGGKAVCLVRRFDRQIEDGHIYRKGFLSARTVFHADSTYAQVGTGSYQRLSRWMPRYGGTDDARRQLFRRLVFNVMIRNDDDHELNHGLIHVERDVYTLAKAYDLVPSQEPRAVHHHALLIGESDAGTVSNLLANSEPFLLSREEARQIIFEVQEQVLDQWRDFFYEAGLDDADLAKVDYIFKPIPSGITR